MLAELCYADLWFLLGASLSNALQSLRDCPERSAVSFRILESLTAYLVAKPVLNLSQVQFC